MKYIFKYGSVHSEDYLTPEQIKEEERTKGKLQGAITKMGYVAVDNRTKFKYEESNNER